MDWMNQDPPFHGLKDVEKAAPAFVQGPGKRGSGDNSTKAQKGSD